MKTGIFGGATLCVNVWTWLFELDRNRVDAQFLQNIDEEAASTLATA